MREGRVWTPGSLTCSRRSRGDPTTCGSCAGGSQAGLIEVSGVCGLPVGGSTSCGGVCRWQPKLCLVRCPVCVGFLGRTPQDVEVCAGGSPSFAW